MELSERTIKRAILTGFGILGVTTVVNQLMKRRPKPYRRAGVISRLFIYPVKSLPPIEVNELEHDEFLVHYRSLKDRAFMLVNRKNVMLTMRQEPRLALLDVRLDYPNIVVSTPDGSESIEIPINDEDWDDQDLFDIPLGEGTSKAGQIIETSIWGDDVSGIDCGSKFCSFFSNYLGKPDIKLIRFASDKVAYRPSQYYREGELGKDSDIRIMYQDSASVHVVNQKSVDHLNQWIEDKTEKVSFANFRPNILIEAEAFDEDNWDKMKIGSTHWQGLLKCIRCRVTTVNLESGTFMKEPLRTLKRFRFATKQDMGYLEAAGVTSQTQLAFMGVFFKPESPGTLKVGQEIWASHRHGFFWFT